MRRLLLTAMMLCCLTACGKKTTIQDGPGKTTGGSTGNATGGTTGGTTGNCTPNCAGRVCGPDGCGSFCGQCINGSQCNPQGQCACTPKCTGKQCGPDGCGQTCGSCATGTACNGVGQCVKPNQSGCVPKCAGKICGDDSCGSLCGKCPVGQVCSADGKKCVTGGANACGSVSEIGECQKENKLAVSCTNGKLVALVCDAAQGLTCGYNASKNKYDCVKSGCNPNCIGKVCGPDGCGGQCGKCPANETCNANGKCQVGSGCQANCSGKTCGPDGCGGQCGICSAGEKCGPNGQCINQSNCTPNCSGKVCGPNGCGGSCGTCGSNQQCKSGVCKATSGGCTPNCTNKQCGSNGCGGSCGECPNSQNCDALGHCVTVGGGNCGSLTFEGTCSDNGLVVSWCEGGQIKNQDCTEYGEKYVCGWQTGEGYYWCIDKCKLACSGKECGSNGCGGSCGTCVAGKICSTVGTCESNASGDCGSITFAGVCEGNVLKYCSVGALIVTNCGVNGKVCEYNDTLKWYECATPQDGCVPNCVTKNSSGVTVPKECGDDGCGNSCGTCQSGKVCDFGLCVAGQSNCGTVGQQGKCEGNKLITCVNGELQTKDCGAVGQTCTFIEFLDSHSCVAEV